MINDIINTSNDITIIDITISDIINTSDDIKNKITDDIIITNIFNQSKICKKKNLIYYRCPKCWTSLKKDGMPRIGSKNIYHSCIMSDDNITITNDCSNILNNKCIILSNPYYYNLTNKNIEKKNMSLHSNFNPKKKIILY